MTRRRNLRVAGAAVVFALVNAACIAEEAPLDWLRPAGPAAEQIGDLWTVVFWAAVAVFFLVEGAIVYSLWRFRERKGDTELPVQTHGNTRLEVAWTIVPALILAALAVPTLSTIFAIAQEPDDPIRVEVEAHQWWWAYTYTDEEVVTANELHIPVGRPIRLELTSADIIHSYWVPRLAGKMDVVPGRTNILTIEASEPGEFFGTCVEYCGLSHANMRFRVFAHEEAEWRQWLEEQRADAVVPTEGLAAQGREIFMGAQCVACHSIRGEEPAQGVVAPDLTHFASRTTFAGSIFDRTDENVRRWVADAPGVKPGALMPSAAEMGLTAEEVEALVAYLQSLE